MIWLTLLRKFWKPALAVAVVLGWSALMYGWGYSTKGVACEAAMSAVEANAHRAIAEFHKAERDAVRKARDAEIAHAKRLAEIAEQHEQDKRDAEAAAADTIAGLRAGTIRLRQHWQGCQATSRVSGDAASSALADANARLREADAGAAIGDARRADDWIKRLQDVVRSRE